VAVSEHQCTVEEENGRFNVYKRNVLVVSSKIEKLGETEKRKEKMKQLLFGPDVSHEIPGVEQGEHKLIGE
jgi:hypothetical protein